MSSSSAPRGPATESTITNGYTPEEGLQLGEMAATANFSQLVCAFDFIVKLLQDNGIDYAGMGGLALLLRGSRRDTHDVDASAECDMHTLRQICKGQPRLRMPLGPTAGVMRVFIEVGPKYGEDVAAAWVQADIILPGSLGAPAMLEGNSEAVTAPTPMGTREYNLIDLRHQMQSKLGSFFARGSGSDFTDILFMCNKFGPKIAQFRNQLDLAHRQHLVARLSQSGGPQATNLKKVKFVLGIP